jgi:hypothetical protein
MMDLLDDCGAMLFAPFPDKAISWRVGSTTKDKSRGMALAYIDARDVMRRLDEACGVGGWQCEYVPMTNGTICCRIGIQSPSGEWVWKANGGSVTGDVDNEKEREMAEKGGYSDAFKRAAVLWGVGRYLYDIDTPWVELEPKGTSHVMKAGERAKLDKAHANYVRNYFRNAAPSDAGQRETPKSQQKTGADGLTSAPVNELNGEEVDQTTQPEWPILEAEMEDYSTREDLKLWWTTPDKKALKARKPHLMRSFYRIAFQKRWDELGETVEWTDEAGARG